MPESPTRSDPLAELGELSTRFDRMPVSSCSPEIVSMSSATSIANVLTRLPPTQVALQELVNERGTPIRKPGHQRACPEAVTARFRRRSRLGECGGRAAAMRRLRCP